MQLLNTFTLLNPYLNNEQLHNATREFPFLKKFALHCMMCESTFPKFSYEEGSLIIYIYSFGCFHLKYTPLLLLSFEHC